MKGLDIIGSEHCKTALNAAIDNATQSIRDGYQKATIVAKTKSKFDDVVASCALADVDEFGTFASRDLIAPYLRITGKRINPKDLAYNLQRLCEPERGQILSRVGEARNIRYEFNNPLMKVFIKMKLDQRGYHESPSLFADR